MDNWIPFFVRQSPHTTMTMTHILYNVQYIFFFITTQVTHVTQVTYLTQVTHVKHHTVIQSKYLTVQDRAI